MGFLNNDGVIYLWNKVKALFNKGITNLSISGRTITWTKGDGTTGTLTTQDTNTTYGVVSKSANGLAPKLPDETSTKKYLRQDGTWAIPPDNNTTYSDMKGATTSAAGTHGLAPAPAAGAANRYLRSDGTWVVPPNDNTTYNDATQTAHGLMTAADKKKLDGIAENANNYSHPTSSGYKHIPAGGSSGKILRWSADGTAVWGEDKDTTYSRFTSANDGLVPAPNDSGDILLATGTWGIINLEQGENPQLGKTIDLVIDDIPYGSVNIPYVSANVNGLATTAMYTKLANLPTASQLSDTYAKKSDIAGIYKYKGSVADASKLPTTGQTVGDVYNIETASAYGAAGANVAWNGTAWDSLGEIFTIKAITNTELDKICV